MHIYSALSPLIDSLSDAWKQKHQRHGSEVVSSNSHPADCLGQSSGPLI